jgi:hypothetical protein
MTRALQETDEQNKEHKFAIHSHKIRDYNLHIVLLMELKIILIKY